MLQLIQYKLNEKVETFSTSKKNSLINIHLEAPPSVQVVNILLTAASSSPST